MSRSRSRAEERLRSAFELHEFGVSLYRQRLRREHPEWTVAQVDRAVATWLAGSPLQGPPATVARWRRRGLEPPGRTA